MSGASAPRSELVRRTGPASGRRFCPGRCPGRLGAPGPEALEPTAGAVTSSTSAFAPRSTAVGAAGEECTAECPTELAPLAVGSVTPEPPIATEARPCVVGEDAALARRAPEGPVPVRTGRACSSRASRAIARRRSSREIAGPEELAVAEGAGGLAGPDAGRSARVEWTPAPRAFPGGPPAVAAPELRRIPDELRERESADVVIRPIASSSAGIRMDTVCGARRPDPEPGAVESFGMRRTTRRKPRPGSCSLSSTAGTHQRGGRGSSWG